MPRGPSLLVAAACVLTLGTAALGCAGGPTREQVQQAQREYDLGVGLWGEQNVAGAFEHLLEAIRLDPDNSEAHLMLGNLYMIHRHDFDQAETHFQEAIRANGAAPLRSGLEADARNSLGVLYIHAERLDEATVVLRESAADLMNREPAVAWTNLGWAYQQQGQSDQALEALSQAVRLSPMLCMAWYRIGETRRSQERWDDAEDALNRALEVENETCQSLQAAWRLRGEVRAQLGHREEATGDLERCVELSPDTDDGRACRQTLGDLPPPSPDSEPASADPEFDSDRPSLTSGGEDP